MEFCFVKAIKSKSQESIDIELKKMNKTHKNNIVFLKIDFKMDRMWTQDQKSLYNANKEATQKP